MMRRTVDAMKTDLTINDVRNVIRRHGLTFDPALTRDELQTVVDQTMEYVNDRGRYLDPFGEELDAVDDDDVLDTLADLYGERRARSGRLCRRVTAGAYPDGVFVSRVRHDLVQNSCDRKIRAELEFVTAKQLLADLPIIPTGERVYELTQQLRMGLLDDICDGDLANAKQHWPECVDAVRQYLLGIGILVDIRS